MRRLLNNRPTYSINDEAFDNQALARSSAFGRDRAIQMQEQQLEKGSANTINQARDVSSSTSGLLSTLAAIQANQDESRVNLATTEAGIQRQNRADLYNANADMIDEKDKAFDYNVNQPYQNKIQELRDRRKAKGELIGNVVGGITSIGASLIGGGFLNSAK